MVEALRGLRGLTGILGILPLQAKPAVPAAPERKVPTLKAPTRAALPAARPVANSAGKPGTRSAHPVAQRPQRQAAPTSGGKPDPEHEEFGAAPTPRPAATQVPPRRPAQPGATASRPATKTAPVVAQPASPAASQALEVRGRREEADEEKVEELLAYEGDVPTLPGCGIETTDQQRAVCAYLSNGTLLVSKNDPLNPHIMQVRAALRRAGRTVRIEYTVELDVIRKVYEAAERRSGALLARQVGTEMQTEFIKLVNEAARNRCSDIHVIVGRHEAEIRVRTDGAMRHLRQLPAAFASELCAAAHNMADASDSSYKMYNFQGARISSTATPLPEGVQALRLQFNPLPNGGRYMICRLLYVNSQAGAGADIDGLGYGRVHIEQIKRMRRKPFGINIISGPTGSGKSTTLERALSALIREKRGTANVITIEDPPEYVIHGAAQLPVTNASTDEERSEKFREAITASLRSDPDIIMIGEIRDRASSKLAFAAAMTGHQVWASLHANDALSIIDRFRDHEVDEYKLSDHTLVTGLVGQRLIRRLCDHCKHPFHEAHAQGLLDYELAERVIRVAGDRLDDVCVARERGCEHCRNGYTGRVVIAECIVPDQAFMARVRNHDKHGALRHWLEHLDGLTMLEHAVQKLVRGWVDPRDVEDKAGDLIEFDEARSSRVFGALFD